MLDRTVVSNLLLLMVVIGAFLFTVGCKSPTEISGVDEDDTHQRASSATANPTDKLLEKLSAKFTQVGNHDNKANDFEIEFRNTSLKDLVCKVDLKINTDSFFTGTTLKLDGLAKKKVKFQFTGNGESVRLGQIKDGQFQLKVFQCEPFEPASTEVFSSTTAIPASRVLVSGPVSRFLKKS